MPDQLKSAPLPRVLGILGGIILLDPYLHSRASDDFFEPETLT